ncbi:hypothetical protein ABQG71_17035 [Bacillus altitudinis]|uniref:Uncharacterized protein n=1 Tax=Bacillus altitudinis TaxID=293387 RepID=A0ABV1S8K0_BACAB
MKIKGAIIMENIALPKETFSYSKMRLNESILDQSNNKIVQNELTNLFNELQLLIKYMGDHLREQLNSNHSNKNNEYFKGLFHEVYSTSRKLKNKGLSLKNEIIDYLKCESVDNKYLLDVLRYEQKITKRFLIKELNSNYIELICSYISELLANLKMNLRIKKNVNPERKVLLTQGKKQTVFLESAYNLTQNLYKDKMSA